MAHFTDNTVHIGSVSEEEIAAMAHVLSRRYSCGAAEIALYFEAEHRAVADCARAAIWAKVAELLRKEGPAPTLS